MVGRVVGGALAATLGQVRFGLAEGGMPADRQHIGAVIDECIIRGVWLRRLYRGRLGTDRLHSGLGRRLAVAPPQRHGSADQDNGDQRQRVTGIHGELAGAMDGATALNGRGEVKCGATEQTVTRTS